MNMDQFNALVGSIFPSPDSEELSKALAIWRFKSYKIVFTQGYFDVIHKGQVEYLAKTAEFGDVLIVGLHTDKSAKQLRGHEGYPTQDEHSRAAVLASLQYVKAVVFFEGDPLALIEKIVPDVLAGGPDFTPETLPGADFVRQHGGQVVIVETLNTKNTPGLISGGDDTNEKK